MHEAEDGWLARVRLPGGRATTEQLRALARAAEGGSGLVDITRRANVQLRGLDAGDAPALAEAFSAVGLIPSAAHERVRNIVASPLGGRQAGAVALTDDVVDELDRALCGDGELATLPDRFLFAVDDGGGMLPQLRPDVGLMAEVCPHGLDAARFRLTIDGVPTTALAPRGSEAALALDAARAFLRLRTSRSERAWHARELTGGAGAVAAETGAGLLPRIPARATPVRPGMCEQRDGRVAVTALPPLGRLDGPAVAGIADLAAECTRSDVRFSTERTVTLVDVPARLAGCCRRRLHELGLLTAPGSGWQRLSACSGTGACSKALVDVRAAAAQRAALRDAAAPAEHWSACPRRCGEPLDVPVLVVAQEAGLTVRRHGATFETAGVRDALALLSSGVEGTG